MIWLFAAIIAIFCLRWAWDVYRNSHPLDKNEILALAKKRQRSQALSRFDFSKAPYPADAAEKKAMKGQGELVTCDWSYQETPARIAGLLKYKKHEWIIMAFIKDFRVRFYWQNKGPDGTIVWSFLPEQTFQGVMRSLRPDCVAILHNHPNPNPAVFSASAPSESDLRSAKYYDEALADYGVTLLEFICERGTPYLYYAAFRDSVAPIEPIVADIRTINGRGVFKNYGLRKELKKVSRADDIAGA